MSIYGNLDFIDLKYRPTESDVILDYKIIPAKGVSVGRAAEFIAGESSIGTWTKIQTMNPVIAQTLKPHVFSVDEKTGRSGLRTRKCFSSRATCRGCSAASPGTSTG